MDAQNLGNLPHLHLLVLDRGRVQARRTGLSRTQEGSRAMGFAQLSRPIPQGPVTVH